ncbi:MAG: UDP-N-acetylmuramate dehydrogenase [Clostridia bacterium]|nr:UDP-N-acetylmuramate dehydrogenase [Clostridia bacterium]
MTDPVFKLSELLDRFNLENDGAVRVLYGEPMSRHTSFRIGGPASLFLIPKNEETLCSVCSMAKEAGIRVFLLGNGSNVLFDDGGFDGAVISTSALHAITVESDRIRAEAGASLGALSVAARENGLTGLEFSYGIPGTVGGAVLMNAGAYGGEIKDVLESSASVDCGGADHRTLTASEHAFGYRDSVYRHENRVILSAVFRLQKGEKEEIAAKMNDFMGRRVSKQPLEYPSAGSVFKRPEGHFVGQMVEESGLKGYGIGGAQVSEKHAGFIINRGGATSADVLALVEHIRSVILKNYGCELQCEIIHVK